LLAASQDDDLVEVFAIDVESGTLATSGEPLRIGTPVCLCFVDASQIGKA
jgi:6-phosphogluconolactonase (cycloisomerase 2 family)